MQKSDRRQETKGKSALLVKTTWDVVSSPTSHNPKESWKPGWGREDKKKRTVGMGKWEIPGKDFLNISHYIFWWPKISRIVLNSSSPEMANQYHQYQRSSVFPEMCLSLAQWQQSKTSQSFLHNAICNKYFWLKIIDGASKNIYVMTGCIFCKSIQEVLSNKCMIRHLPAL